MAAPAAGSAPRRAERIPGAPWLVVDLQSSHSMKERHQGEPVAVPLRTVTASASLAVVVADLSFGRVRCLPATAVRRVASCN